MAGIALRRELRFLQTLQNHALPLLAFAAASLWERRDRENGLLTREAYAAQVESLWNRGGCFRLASDVSWEVRNEQKIAVRVENSILSGNIDRLIVVRSGKRYLAADVIDYKTDNLQEDEDDCVGQRVDFYRSQLESYRQAVARMLQLDTERIALRLAFVKKGLVVNI